MAAELCFSSHLLKTPVFFHNICRDRNKLQCPFFPDIMLFYSRQCLFLKNPCIFQQNNPKPHTTFFTAVRLGSRVSFELACLRSRFLTDQKHSTHHENPARSPFEQRSDDNTTFCSSSCSGIKTVVSKHRPIPILLSIRFCHRNQNYFIYYKGTFFVLTFICLCVTICDVGSSLSCFMMSFLRVLFFCVFPVSLPCPLHPFLIPR